MTLLPILMTRTPHGHETLHGTIMTLIPISYMDFLWSLSHDIFTRIYNSQFLSGWMQYPILEDYIRQTSNQSPEGMSLQSSHFFYTFPPSMFISCVYLSSKPECLMMICFVTSTSNSSLVIPVIRFITWISLLSSFHPVYPACWPILLPIHEDQYRYLHLIFLYPTSWFLSPNEIKKFFLDFTFLPRPKVLIYKFQTILLLIQSQLITSSLNISSLISLSLNTRK